MDVLSALKYRRTATEWDVEKIPSKDLISKIIEDYVVAKVAKFQGYRFSYAS